MSVMSVCKSGRVAGSAKSSVEGEVMVVKKGVSQSWLLSKKSVNVTLIRWLA